ncbi:hypothetical protein HID58_015855 [Brassica napus]|uniref:Uncharacterized protein n=1 Tax=Brassica napus TaxID=3708 RepID=A0ABQ8DN34_BRANA|nr:hypothetical protein HID58_015855 [Brassica napus]
MIYRTLHDLCSHWDSVLRYHRFVGDAVVLKDPKNSDKCRRIRDGMGDDDKEELFVLEKDQCWVVVENKEITAKHMIVVTFGPVSTANIVGRAMYCLRTAVVHGHGPVRNRYKKAESQLIKLAQSVTKVPKKKEKMVVQLRTNQQAIAGLSGAKPLSVHCREREVVAALLFAQQIPPDELYSAIVVLLLNTISRRTLAYYLDLLVWFTTHKTSRKRYWRKVQAQLRARAAAKKEDKKLLMPHPCTAK